MTEGVSYARIWKAAYKEAGPRLTPDEARQLHDTGQTYAALLGPDGQPGVVVTPTLSAGVTSVDFLDARLRRVMTYLFGHADSSRIFLEQVHVFTYADDDDYGDNPTHVDNTYFRREGTWHAERQTRGQAAEAADGVMPADALAANWELIPAFGDYAGISRRDR